MHFMIKCKFQRVNLSRQVSKQQIQLSLCFLVLEFHFEVFYILENWEIVSAIYHEDCRLHLLYWKFDMLAH